MPRKDYKRQVVDAVREFIREESEENKARLIEALVVHDEHIRHRNRSRRVVNYKKDRKKLIRVMGGTCTKCGRKRGLEFDHINGRDWDPAKTSRWARLARYKREFEAGELRLLCRSCNGSDNKKKVRHAED